MSLIDPAYLAETRPKLIGQTPGAQSDEGRPAREHHAPSRPRFAPMPEQPEYGTSPYLHRRQPQGNALAMTTTIEDAFGARQMVKGFLLNNELTDFSFAPTDADRCADRQPGAARQAPALIDGAHAGVRQGHGAVGHKRRQHGRRADHPPHGPKDLVRRAQLGHEPAAGHQPARTSRSLNGPTVLEDKRFPAATVNALKARGHEVRETGMTSGLQAITSGQAHGMRLWMGGADPRREGVVMGD
jgi:gamma-glutamyltranspeptidase/glutathione hydrolase